jgi:protein transport protein SEC24
VLAAIDCDKGILATLKHEQRLQSGGTVFLQAGLLYTAPDRTRRIRVHTLALPVAGSIGGIFRGADLETTVQALAVSHVCLALPSSTLFSVRAALENRCVEVLTAYRKQCAVRSSGDGQLILPESLKLLPLYTCMLCKTRPLASFVEPDVRAAALLNWACATARRFSQSVLPRLVDVCAAQERPGLGWTPAAYLAVSSESFAAAGVYLIENGCEVRALAALGDFPLSHLYGWCRCYKGAWRLLAIKLRACSAPERPGGSSTALPQSFAASYIPT